MILITGASGFVGGRLLRRLMSGDPPSGPVRAMVRRASSGPDPGPGLEVVQADLTMPATLAAAVEGVETVIHAAAITADRKETRTGEYAAVNQAGTENLVAAAGKAGVARLVAVSGLGTRPAPAGSYMATRWGMEEAVRGSGIPYVILQPSVLFGGPAPFVAALAHLARRSPILPLLGAGVRFQPLWVEDLVTCVLASTAAGSPPDQVLPLGGAEQLTFREILAAVCETIGVRRLMVPVPLPLARVQAELMTALLPNPPLTPGALELFGFQNVTRGDSVERAFGFAPRGFREHLAAHGIDG